MNAQPFNPVLDEALGRVRLVKLEVTRENAETAAALLRSAAMDFQIVPMGEGFARLEVDRRGAAFLVEFLLDTVSTLARLSALEDESNALADARVRDSLADLASTHVIAASRRYRREAS